MVKFIATGIAGLIVVTPSNDKPPKPATRKAFI